jgi:hypothetical protein
MKHISEQPVCARDNIKLKRMKPGQVWTMEGYFDLDQFGGNKHLNGSLDEVMATALVYVRRKGGA